MSNMNLQHLVSEPVMESFYDMRNAQDPKDRLHYFDKVLEGSAETNAVLLQKLYTDIISRSNIDFGTIPDSQGALIKYKEYKLMSQSMSHLNELYEGNLSEEVVMMNKIHDMIITCRKDYELGYKFDIEIIKIAYCTAVMTLFELINICILEYTRKLRSDKGISFDFGKVKKKDMLFIRGAKSLIHAYEGGQWNALMVEIRKHPMQYSASVATEAIIPDMVFDKASDIADTLLSGSGVIKQGLGPRPSNKVIVNTLAKNAKPLIKSGVSKLNAIPLPFKIIGIAIAILMAIRTLILVFFNSAAKLKDWVRIQKEFVEADIRQEMEEGKVSNNVIEKHKRLADRLEGIANFIEIRIFKTDIAAKKDMMESNRDNYNKSDFTNPSFGFGGSIEF